MILLAASEWVEFYAIILALGENIQKRTKSTWKLQFSKMELEEFITDANGSDSNNSP
jgi:hypothetical protein